MKRLVVPSLKKKLNYGTGGLLCVAYKDSGVLAPTYGDLPFSGLLTDDRPPALETLGLKERDHGNLFALGFIRQLLERAIASFLGRVGHAVQV